MVLRRCRGGGPCLPLPSSCHASRLVLWGLHPWRGHFEVDGHISAIGQVLEVVGSFSLSLSLSLLPSLPLFFFFPHPSIHSHHPCPRGVCGPIREPIRMLRDFPGHPVVRTPRSHSRGPGFDPWLGNEDPVSRMAWPKKIKRIKTLNFISRH